MSRPLPAHIARFALAPLALAALPTAQTLWYVEASACPGPGTGTSEDPFCSIQDAIDAATSGDRILVGPGSYAENVRFDGKDVLLRAVEGPSTTRIAPAFALPSLVTFDAGEGPGAVLEGFSVGTASFTSSSRGILCDGSSPTIRGNVIENHTPSEFGGGIACLNGAAPEIVGNHVRNNDSAPGEGAGGGIYAAGSSPWIHGNVIEGNTAFYDGGGRGGGIYVAGSNVIVENNLFLANGVCDQGAGEGGAIGASFSTLLLRGNTFARNAVCTTGFGFGGALWLQGGTTTIRNTLFFENFGANGSEIYMTAGASVTIEYSRLEVSAQTISGTPAYGPGMTNALPVFADDRYHLAAGSPLVDVGDPMLPAGGTDGDLDPRLLDGDADGSARVDIGWDEHNATRLSVSGTPTGGQALTFDTTAPAGWKYLLALSLGRGDVDFGALGSSLLAPGSLRLLALGTVPGSDVVNVPPAPALRGLAFHVQSMARAGAAGPGSFSRRIELVVR